MKGNWEKMIINRIKNAIRNYDLIEKLIKEMEDPGVSIF